MKTQTQNSLPGVSQRGSLFHRTWRMVRDAPLLNRWGTEGGRAVQQIALFLNGTDRTNESLQEAIRVLDALVNISLHLALTQNEDPMLILRTHSVASISRRASQWIKEFGVLPEDGLFSSSKIDEIHPHEFKTLALTPYEKLTEIRQHRMADEKSREFITQMSSRLEIPQTLWDGEHILAVMTTLIVVSTWGNPVLSWSRNHAALGSVLQELKSDPNRTPSWVPAGDSLLEPLKKTVLSTQVPFSRLADGGWHGNPLLPYLVFPSLIERAPDSHNDYWLQLFLDHPADDTLVKAMICAWMADQTKIHTQDVNLSRKKVIECLDSCSAKDMKKILKKQAPSENIKDLVHLWETFCGEWSVVREQVQATRWLNTHLPWLRCRR